MGAKLVSHGSVAAALAQLQDEPLATPSAFESASVTDAELRGYLAEALAVLEAQGETPGVMVTAQHQLASLLQTHLVEHPETIELIERPAPNNAFEVKFDKGDVLGWARSLLDWWRKIKPEPWIAPSDDPEPFGDGTRAKIALLGDWGTGLYGAPVIAETISAEGGFDLLVHLGDVYYSGTPRGSRAQLQGLLAQGRRAGEPRDQLQPRDVLGWRRALQASRCRAFGQRATHVVVRRTDDWLLVGLDSAYEDHDLAHDQAQLAHAVSWSARARDGCCCSRTTSRTRCSTTRDRS